MWLLLLTALLAHLLRRAVLCRCSPPLFKPSELSGAALDPASLAGSEQSLAAGIAIPTVSRQPGDPPRQELLRYHAHLRAAFPTVFGSDVVHVETVNELSLLLTVAGTEPQLQPYLLMSHLDVVPAVEDQWTSPPFAGLVQDGFVIGRGAIDVKQTTHAILESLERRLAAGDRPRRPLYVALGHDEEVSGWEGAAHVAALLEQRHVRVAFVLDEGPFVMRDMPGIRCPVAQLAVAEKGYMDVQLTARGTVKHSSIPPPPGSSAIDRLTRAVQRLQKSQQLAQLDPGIGSAQFEELAPLATPLYRLLYANVRLFAPALRWMGVGTDTLMPYMQTTTAVTVIKGGYKVNVVPAEATAIVNHRVIPGETSEEVLERDRRVISDPQVELKVLHYKAPARVSPYGERSPAFSLVAATTRQVHGEQVAVAPSVLVASTDSYHYQNITENIIRFDPIVLRRSELRMFHGNDEMISIENYHGCVQFYYRLMKNLESAAVISKLP